MAKERTSDGKPEARRTSLWRSAAAELLGTFLLTFVAAGADIIAFRSGGTVAHIERYLAPAMLVTAMIWSLSGISGAHLNPAVTFAFTLRRSFPAPKLPLYIAAQFGGAVLGALTLQSTFGGLLSHGITKPSPPFTPAEALAIEVMLSFALVLTILLTSEEEAVVGKNAALAVGSVIALSGIAFGPASGASMNPARSLGPMLLAGQLELWPIYVFGPLTGAALAVACAWLLLGSPSAHGQRAAGGRG